MKVLLLNGSAHAHGCTARALEEMARVFAREGVETQIVQAGSPAIRGCAGCGGCRKTGRCVFEDPVNDIAPLFEAADGLVVGSPVYYAHASGGVLSLLDRLFYSTRFSKCMKVGAAVVSSRRAGSTGAFDDINKYFTISGMPVAGSTYWNEVHGFTAADVEKDLEGLQTLRNLARSMVFLMRSIQLGKAQFGLPEFERGSFTSFSDGL